MCTILLPIKPEYVEKIINQSKRYEYRRKIGKKKVDRIIIYSTYPIKMVIAEVEVKKVLTDTPDNIWEKTKNYSGISKEKYSKYFCDKNKAFAYQLGKVLVYSKPKRLEDFNIYYSPQSFVYLKIENI